MNLIDIDRAKSYTTESETSVRSYPCIRSMNRQSRSIRYLSRSKVDQQLSTTCSADPVLVADAASRHHKYEDQQLDSLPSEAQTQAQNQAAVSFSSEGSKSRNSLLIHSSINLLVRQGSPKTRTGYKTPTSEKGAWTSFSVASPSSAGSMIERARSFVSRSLGRTRKSKRVKELYLLVVAG